MSLWPHGLLGRGPAVILLLAFCLGLTAVAWVGAGYGGAGAVAGNPLALVMTGLIAAAYLTGAAELRRFHQATQGLQAALQALPGLHAQGEGAAPLGHWLARLHPTLQAPARLRIEGERPALPGPVLTPYLVGLLVLLGMLGTFLGMVVTMQGAVLALQASTDLATVRSALAAPVQGLGLAFGTSVAGVAASAMLGLMSALCRRQRLQATQELDALAARHLRGQARVHQREQALAALQAVQAQTAPLQLLPQVLDHLQAQALQGTALAQASHDSLLQRQDDFQQQALQRTGALARAIEEQVQLAAQEAARLAGATLQPLVSDLLTGVRLQLGTLQQQVLHSVQQSLQHHLQAQVAAVGQQQADWLERLAQAQAQQQVQQQARAAAADEQRLAQWSAQLASTTHTLQQAWQQAGEQAQAQQAQVCATLAQTAHDLQAQARAHAHATLAELSQLAASAAQAPQAAAELVRTLRQQLSDSLAQDQQRLAERNEHLAERSQLLTRLNSVLEGVQQQAEAQRQATQQLLAAAAEQWQQAGQRLQERVAADTDRLAATGTELGARAQLISAQAAEVSAAAADVGASAVDMASLADAFAAAVQLFSHSNSALGTQLQRIEAALARSTTRSDEQLAYYVAQAREIVDLSISSQQQIVQDLRQLAQPRPARVEEPA